MLTIGFPAAVAGTNCYVLAPAAGEECLIVDPGVGVTGQLAELLREHRLRPAAVLLTHGHFDHVYSVAPVCDSAAVAAYIHGDDRYRLKDPLSAVGPQLIAMFEQQFGQRASWKEPTDVVSLVDGQRLTIAGLDLRVLHAPGHTQGSVMFALPEVPEGIAADVGARQINRRIARIRDVVKKTTDEAVTVANVISPDHVVARNAIGNRA